MANRRAQGIIVRSFSVPADLHAAAKAKAESEGTNLSAVIRAALERYVRSKR